MSPDTGDSAKDDVQAGRTQKVPGSVSSTRIMGDGPPGDADGPPGATEAESILAEVAARSGMVSAAKVRECLDALVEARGKGLSASLESLLVANAGLTRNQVQVLRDAAQRHPKMTTRILGGFRLFDKIAEGGMGVVYRGQQLALDRQVAVKVLSPRLASDVEFVKRLGLEAKAVAKLDHPNIVRAIDFGEAEGKYYFAMEFVDGESLDDVLIRRGKLPEVEALAIAMQVTRGMQCAWQSSIVHRDMKPGNILITKNGTAKIADLGLVRQVGGTDATDLTQAGTILGTPDYVAPEQAEGVAVDVRADIYALGVTLYETVTGELPFRGEDAISVIRARFKTRPQPAYIVNPDVSEEFSGVIETMMALDPEHRYPDPAVLLDDLESVAEGGVPRYAVSMGPARERAAEAARSRRVDAASVPIPIVLRKRRRRRLFIVAGAVAGSVVLVLLAAFILSRSGDGGTRTDPLEEEARELRDRLLGIFSSPGVDSVEGGGEADYERIVREVDEAGSKYVGTEAWGRIDTLRIEAERETLKGEVFANLTKQAREAISGDDYDGALRLLTEALKLRHTEEVDRVMEGTRRLGSGDIDSISSSHRRRAALRRRPFGIRVYVTGITSPESLHRNHCHGRRLCRGGVPVKEEVSHPRKPPGITTACEGRPDA